MRSTVCAPTMHPAHSAALLPCVRVCAQSLCTEAGLLALRERRMKVCQVDMKKAKDSVLYKKKDGAPEGLYL